MLATRSIALTGVEARLIDVHAELVSGTTETRTDAVVSSATRETVDRGPRGDPHEWIRLARQPRCHHLPIRWTRCQ